MNPWIVIVTVLALFLYFYTAINVARARRSHEIPAPAMSGHPTVERALRVQGNTLEWLVIFLPGLWLFAAYFDPRVAAALGVVWLIGRILFMQGYMAEPDKRRRGFGIQAMASLVLLLGGLAGAVLQLVHGG